MDKPIGGGKHQNMPILRHILNIFNYFFIFLMVEHSPFCPIDGGVYLCSSFSYNKRNRTICDKNHCTDWNWRYLQSGSCLEQLCEYYWGGNRVRHIRVFSTRPRLMHEGTWLTGHLWRSIGYQHPLWGEKKALQGILFVEGYNNTPHDRNAF